MGSKNNWISLLLDNNGYIVLNKVLIKTIGLETTVLLGELISEYNYYEKTNELTNKEWFYSTQQNITENTGLTRYSIDESIKKLTKLHYIETRIMGMPSKKYYKIDFKTIEKTIKNIKFSPKNQGCRNQQARLLKSANKDAEISKQGCQNQQTRLLKTANKVAENSKQGCRKQQTRLSKSATNNNNITIINNNNNKQSIISGKDGLVAQNDYAQFVDKINLKELLKQYKEPSTDRANLENILKIIQNLFNQKNNKVISVGKNEEVTIDYFKDYLIKNYSFGTIEYILECYKNNTTKIKNIKKYITTMLYNAPQTIDLYYYNSVESDKNNINKRPNDYYENLFLEKSKAKAYGSSK